MKSIFVLILCLISLNFAQSQDQLLQQALNEEANNHFAKAFILLEQALYTEGEQELDIRILLRDYYLALDLPADYEQNELMIDLLLLEQPKKKSQSIDSSMNSIAN